MSYQELIKLYPWVDLAMEMIKGVMPTVVAIWTVIITQHYTKKRELQHKEKEMRLEYLEKILNWIHQIKNDIFEVSEMLEKALEKNDFQEREEKFKNFRQELTKMNTSFATWADTYNSVTTVFGYDIKLQDFKESMCTFGDKMINIFDKYKIGVGTYDAMEEINNQTECVMKDLNICVSEIAKVIALLYEK